MRSARSACPVSDLKGGFVSFTSFLFALDVISVDFIGICTCNGRVNNGPGQIEDLEAGGTLAPAGDSAESQSDWKGRKD